MFLWLYLALLKRLFNKLTCGLQRHAAGADTLQDPLLGYGDPYGGQNPPAVHASDHAAPPAESIASKATSALTASPVSSWTSEVVQEYACISWCTRQQWFVAYTLQHQPRHQYIVIWYFCVVCV